MHVQGNHAETVTFDLEALHDIAVSIADQVAMREAPADIASRAIRRLMKYSDCTVSIGKPPRRVEIREMRS